MLATRFLRAVIRAGSLKLIDPRGRVHVFGTGGPPQAAIRIHDWRTAFKLGLSPELAVGEGYMNGALTIEEGSLYEFLDLAAVNLAAIEAHPWLAWRRLVTPAVRLLRANPIGLSRRNVAHHYDLTDELFALFLDAERQYSCAYFPPGVTEIDDAQQAKLRHIAAKLLLDRPRLRVLDIGSGWGGLGIYLATETGADVTGLTLSTGQHEVANQRARAAGLAQRVRFDLRDYRQASGRYDRIVSVGMLEHVGARHLRAYFRQVGALLAEDGVALIHSIGRMGPPSNINPWMRKYIFPGAYVPSLSETMAAIEASGLWVTDVEILRVHYADTLRAWRQRFQANRTRIAALYDERFCRMWEFYLTACEIGFRRLDQMVFQIQLAHRRDAVPLVRDYMFDWERSHARPGDGAQAAAE